VDGVAYRFMGTEDVELDPLVPTSEQGEWYGSYTTTQPAANWKDNNFNDSSWKKDKGAFGTKINEPTAKTDWTTENIWVRRHIVLDEDVQGKQIYLEFSNDDDAVFTSMVLKYIIQVRHATKMQ
jgi:L-glutaminase (EC 3.5.1.2)